VDNGATIPINYLGRRPGVQHLVLKILYLHNEVEARSLLIPSQQLIELDHLPIHHFKVLWSLQRVSISRQ